MNCHFKIKNWKVGNNTGANLEQCFFHFSKYFIRMGVFAYKNTCIDNCLKRLVLKH